MGRGDKKTKKGKISQGSYGTSRLKSKTLKAKKKINQVVKKKTKKKSK
ncbi:30S ribosomal protein THX [Aureispira]|nr:30S ribosomal protein THX [Aureispira sp.]